MLFTIISGCIEPYVPNLKASTDEVYVVSGEVTDHEGYQVVTISKASPVGEPEYIPVGGCNATIEDDRGHDFQMEENETGTYRVWMGQEFLSPGISYRLHVITPSAEEIESEYDLMPVCPPIDSIYDEPQEIISQNTGTSLKGLQFYIDFHSSSEDSRFYRWTADETWEYHAPYPIRYYFDGREHEVSPPDYSLNVCWSTEPVKRIFTLSTGNLVSTGYKKLPLHFVDNTTNRLHVKYSVLVSQHALSERAYVFWEDLRVNSEQQGGLYEKQPLPVEGNIQNITYREKKVLGFFGASSVTRKRVFVDGDPVLAPDDGSFCSPEELGIGGWSNVMPWEYPVYFIYVDQLTRTLQKSCADCRSLGGSIVKPEFWPN